MKNCLDRLRSIAPRFFAVLTISYIASLGTAMAADYPTQPLTMIVPYKAGGSTETMARVLSKALSDELGQPVIVKTKPGAGGAVGATFTTQQANDGYTILFTTIHTLAYQPLANPDVTYTADDFSYIAGVTEGQFALVTTPDKPYTNLQELIEYAKANPGLNVADQGGISKTFVNYIAKREGLEWTAIPTRGGGEMVPFLLGGKVDLAYSGGLHQKYGEKMRVLASLLSHRLEANPDAPSVAELYGMSMPGDVVIVGPKGMDPVIVAQLESAVKAALDNPDFEKILGTIGFPKMFQSSAALSERIKVINQELTTVVDATK
jgi:tripartite-type tricarboxylate transporter receptor subunit TctC